MFEYLDMLIAVIMGLALTHLVHGLAKLIHSRRTVRVWWPHILWTINIMIYVLVVWFGMFWWTRMKEWSFLQFFCLIIYCTVMFLLASLLYPPEFPDAMDCRDYFFRNKSWFFGIQIVAFLLDIPETMAKNLTHLRQVPPEYVFFIPVVLTICVVGIVSNSRRVQAVLPVLWIVATLSYVTLTSLDKITA